MTKRMIVAALALAGIFVALYLLLYKLGAIGTLSCSIGSCETVNSSRWATFLGLPVAAWGLGFYVALFAVAMASTTARYGDLARMPGLLLGMTTLGLLFSAWLTYLELFVIGAICQWCVVSAIIVSLCFLVALADFRESARFEDQSVT
jgi:uncharacterized membrane protein